MNKPTCIIYAPIDTFSGYGARSRDIVKSIIELKGEEWNIKIISCSWGNTPNNFLQENQEWSYLETYIIPPHITQQPDYMFWITVPNEFQPVGRWNCGITAGIETTIAPAEWVEGCEKMDLVLCSSKHSLDVLKSSIFDKIDDKTQQKIGTINWSKPGKILFEGANTNVFSPKPSTNIDLSEIKEDFCYLFTGMWTPGNMGEDRKNVGMLIKSFYEIFKNKSKKPALILKTTHLGCSYKDRDEILHKINQIKDTVVAKSLPNIYLFHGEITDSEMNDLYNHPKVKAMVSLTKGEGFGRPLLEFSLTNKPIICSNWSGPVDYLNPEFTSMLGGALDPVSPNIANNMILKESSWFTPDLNHVAYYLTDVFENYKSYLEKAKRQGYYNRTNFSLEKMKEELKTILSELPEPIKQVKLELPKLSKVK